MSMQQYDDPDPEATTLWHELPSAQREMLHAPYGRDSVQPRARGSYTLLRANMVHAGLLQASTDPLPTLTPLGERLRAAGHRVTPASREVLLVDAVRTIAERIRINYDAAESAQLQVASDVRDLLVRLLARYKMTVLCSAGTVMLRPVDARVSDEGALRAIQLLGNRALVMLTRTLVAMLERDQSEDAVSASEMLALLEHTLPWDLGGNTR